jgi:nucleoside-diphosphate-sugar epimerase
MASLSMCEYPHVVVTGASSGAGRAVALCLAASGYHVYSGVRTYAGGVALHQHTPPGAGIITPLLLDISRPIQIMAAVRAVTAHAGPAGLVGLVSYAGTDGSGPRPGLSVTRAFVPLLCRAQGRIVMTGPAGTLRRELAPWNIDVIVIEPAACAGAVARALAAPRPRVAEGSCP